MNEKKLKVGTLTFHMAHNYGAMLQAYALPTVLKKLGYDCEVIDYRFEHIDSWSRIERWDDLTAKHGLIGGGLRFLKRVLNGYYFKKDMHTKFDYFERKIIPCSKNVYRDKSSLNNMPYDVILFGSDQIWNSRITNGIAEEYIGAFSCLPKTKKVAYAASCGSSDFQKESRDFYNECLRDFSAISVREEEFKNTLSERGLEEVELVLDPTLLLTEKDWQRLLLDKENKYPRKYLLLYAFEEDEKLYDVVRDYAKNKDLEIIAIAYTQKESMYDMTVLTDCGPLEFLELFANAEHVITTSFHGTVFAIIFHKSFHCIPHPKYRERTDSLLNVLGLMRHNVNVLRELEFFDVEWDNVDCILETQRKKSFEFLKNALSN